MKKAFLITIAMIFLIALIYFVGTWSINKIYYEKFDTGCCSCCKDEEEICIALCCPCEVDDNIIQKLQKIIKSK